MTTTNTAPLPTSESTTAQFDLQGLEQAIATSRGFASLIIVCLPTLGIAAVLWFQLPLFAALMAGSFMLATSLVCHNAVATFTGKALRLLVAARLVIVMVLACLLFLTTGAVWMTLMSAAVLWLVTDRLMGRRALYDLWELTVKS